MCMYLYLPRVCGALSRYIRGGRRGELKGPVAVADHALPSLPGPRAARKAPEEVRPPRWWVVLVVVYALYDARAPRAVRPTNALKACGGGDAADATEERHV